MSLSRENVEAVIRGFGEKGCEAGRLAKKLRKTVPSLASVAARDVELFLQSASEGHSL